MKNENHLCWNRQQKLLQNLLSKSGDHRQAIDLCLEQHSATHTAEMTDAGRWSFEDEVWENMTESDFRKMPRNGIYSVAWHFWHMTRIEDMTMNYLTAGEDQLLDCKGWYKKMGVSCRDTGNSMNEGDIEKLSKYIDLNAFRQYRTAVGAKTQHLIAGLQPEDLKRKVEQKRLQHLLAAGDVAADATWLMDYWSRRTIAGLLLMPATRHNFVHLNEVLRLL